jgi:hypothetical protein
MKKFSNSFLTFLCCFFVGAEGASNSVTFDGISELDSGNLRIVFTLDQVALINSYALDDPSRIVIDIKNSSLKNTMNADAYSPIRLIRASEVNNNVRIVIDLKGSVFWKKPWQVKHKDRVDLILEIKKDRSYCCHRCRSWWQRPGCSRQKFIRKRCDPPDCKRVRENIKKYSRVPSSND